MSLAPPSPRVIGDDRVYLCIYFVMLCPNPPLGKHVEDAVPPYINEWPRRLLLRCEPHFSVVSHVTSDTRMVMWTRGGGNQARVYWSIDAIHGPHPMSDLLFHDRVLI